MKTILGTIEGSIVLRKDTELLGVAKGMVTVPAGVHLLMEGMVMGDLVVLAGGSAQVNGTVMGYIINDGGTVNLRGVDGELGKAAVLAPRVQKQPWLMASFWGRMSRDM